MINSNDDKISVGMRIIIVIVVFAILAIIAALLSALNAGILAFPLG